MDIAGWLRNLGLGQYEAAFRDNEIDGEVLPNLTADDLKELGVAIVGHRRKLLTAIAELHASATAPAPVAPPAETSPASAQAERRPITVMFCDLVGSTSLAARLDPEDWRNLVGSYLDAASAAVTSLGGHVLKKLGDGLMALFGYPQAQENDGERAVRAALAIQRALADLNARNVAGGAQQLSARIGLDSGRVVVDSSGEVYGDAPNVAARVQSAAAPGEIWITRAVHRQIAGLFVAEDKGGHELKGVVEKAQLYRIVRASGSGRRAGSRAPTPLVGRAEELDLLTRRWERARRGEGQLSLIVGEPGLGKSRLIEEFRARLAETPHTWVEWTSSQLLQNTPLHPIAEWGRARFGGAEVAGEKRLAELEAALGSVGLDAAEYAPLLAPVIDAPLPSDRVPKLSPEELRSRQLAALVAWLLAGARTQPIVLAFEDLHWADPTSLDVLQALAERGAQAPLLIIATTRPEFRPPWKQRSHHGVISLAPLDAGEVARMIGEIATRHALSKDVIAGVSERSGGVPLFVEEVTRLLLERGEAGGVQAIPPTLQQSLAARLDRLGSARETAQIGAVLGRGFSHTLLQAVAGLDEPTLRAALDRLADAELLFVEGVAPHANYRFKHALIQDAAYDSLLKSRRQTLHRRAAEVLLASSAPEAEALAHHFTQAGQTDLAIEWWGKAGDQALRRSAFAEAISHLGKAIELSDKAGGASRPREAAATALASQRLKLQTSYGYAVMWSKGFAAEETKAAFTRVGELATEIGDAEAIGATYFAQWVHSFWRGELGSARETAESFLREAERAARPTEAAAAHRSLGLTCLFQGDFEDARAHFEQTLRIYDPERDREAKFRFGQDSDVGATAYLAHAAWRLGDVGRARELIDAADARAAESAHAPTLANTYIFKTIFEIVRDDAAAALRAAEKGVALSRAHGLEHYLAFGSLASAWGRAKLGDRDAGSTGLRQALAEYVGQGNKFLLPLFQGLLAEIEAERQTAGAALAGIDGALALAGETGEHWFDAGLHRIRSEILLKRNPVNSSPAEEAFLTAIAIAQQQKARSFELRAALSLAKLYQSTGRPIDSHDVLGPALEGFSPTPEFPQIADATALLEVLKRDEAVKAVSAQREGRVKLQLAYGAALISARGYGAQETVRAFNRARELSEGVGGSVDRLAMSYGIWLGAVTTETFEAASKASAALLAEATKSRNPGDLGAAHRAVGATLLYSGSFRDAMRHFDEATSLLETADDAELARRFNGGPRAAVHILRAIAAWATSDFDLAARDVREAEAETERADDAMTPGYVYGWAATLAAVRRDAPLTLLNARRLLKLVAETGLGTWAPVAGQLERWSRSMLGEGPFSAGELRAARSALKDVGHDKILTQIIGVLAAEAEVRTGSADQAIALVEELMAEIRASGLRWQEAELLRVSGEARLIGPFADLDRAGHDLEAAVAVAREQGAHAFELRAALSLAKLYQSSGSPIDAHDVLGPALEGFSPTPEFPAIAEAKALFEALAQTDQVTAAAAAAKRRVPLQIAMGNALIAARGYGAAETKAAFERASELVGSIKDADQRFSVRYGLWVGSYVRDELGAMREAADGFLRDVATQPRSPAAGVAHRVNGITDWYAGDFAGAQTHLEQALAIFDSERDADLAFRFGHDAGVGATGYLSIVCWALGDAARARRLQDQLEARLLEVTHVATFGYAGFHCAMFEMMRGDFARCTPLVKKLVDVAHAHDLAHWQAESIFLGAWIASRADDPGVGLTKLREGATLRDRRNIFNFYGLIKIALALEEARAGEIDAALATLDHSLASSERTGQRCFDAETHRIRGEILLKQNPADPAPAEAAFLAAIAVAQQQKGRSFELRAALSLAKLYQSTGRSIEAHDVLGLALEGFSPTPEFPQIEEAMSFLASIQSSVQV